ncbi:MAG TPA: hypothetical protein H9728_00425 [Candidatus Borkfalkia excrementavium]|uniref:Uncharacterized protein n=1 Tax=Candidatus Borkfalkia excrementavium TaxID=2838505 RepID=A0A9D2CE69_9FIRM|nr:hypothetical protein [Candidatus Borkfalkia excrementavium]
MKDFNSYSKEDQKKAEEELPEDVADMAKKMAAAFDGKGEGDLLRAIYKEAEKGRKNGSLSDADLDNFYAALSPMLDGAKRKKLAFVISKLKKM